MSSAPKYARARITALRRVIEDLLPRHHRGWQSDNAPCNETCTMRSYVCVRHRRDLEPRRGFWVSDRCTGHPDINECDEVCLRCIGLSALEKDRKS